VCISPAVLRRDGQLDVLVGTDERLMAFLKKAVRGVEQSPVDRLGVST